MKCLIIENITNMHVGSGDINYGVVDNLVQKDPISGLPVIHSSSLKGAFREYFEEKYGTDDKRIIYIFGQDNNSSDTKRPGAYSFFEAKLLTRPVRSNKALYFNATSPDVIRNFLEDIEILGIEIDNSLKKALEKLANMDLNEPVVLGDFESVFLEDKEVKSKKIDELEILEKFLGRNIALYPFKDFVDIGLPFIARNNLDEDGISKNLWYEEIVPKYSKFYFFLKGPEKVDEKFKKDAEKFEEDLLNIELIQFGANKSIGYGFSRLKAVK
jgi:CRISPR-associated protein Cmr4